MNRSARARRRLAAVVFAALLWQGTAAAQDSAPRAADPVHTESSVEQTPASDTGLPTSGEPESAPPPDAVPDTAPPDPTSVAPPVETAQPIPAPPETIPDEPLVAAPSETGSPAGAEAGGAPAPGLGAEPAAQDAAPAPAPSTARPAVTPPTSPWSYALITGYYRPRLGTLNRILRDTRLTVLQDPNFLLPRNELFRFEQRNIAVDGLNGGLLYGVEAFYHAGGAHSFGLSVSGWRAETFGRDRINLFLRSNVDSIVVPRSARYNLVLDQIFAEWRYHLVRTPQGRGVYANVGLVGVTLATLTMDALVNVVNPELNFASVSSDESFGWGYTARFGVGGNYPLTSWLSVGGRANYLVGTIRRLKVTKHFLSGFPNQAPTEPLSIRPGVALPQQFFPPREGRTVESAEIVTTGDIQEDARDRTNLVLELSGWEGLLELSFHF
ncbi:MAG: hypothetical protein ACOYXR_07035 [Nitrospirota bacterium]